jgi:hypothetical protein
MRCVELGERSEHHAHQHMHACMRLTTAARTTKQAAAGRMILLQNKAAAQ